MSIIIIASIVILFLLVCIFYSLYVSLIKKRNKVKEAMSGIDVQLKKRYSLIPNILTVANKFMEHEKSLLTEITELRTQAVGMKSSVDNLAKQLELDNQIVSKMGQLMVNLENYPQLKSDQTMVQAMKTYSEIEEHIAAARRFYNSSVNDLNNAVEIFPSSIIAAMISIQSYPFFETTEDATKDVNASDYLK